MESVEKIFSLNNAVSVVRQWQGDGKMVVFTNGCFDILHAGHVQYLEKARAAGDRLVVGVNSDASVRRIKGKKRPVCPEEDRCRVLAGLGCVDAVVVFEEKTPHELISLLLPDVLVKGADWAIDNIVGADTVLARGGRVTTIEFLEGRSTTGIIERVIDAYCPQKRS
ncbi:D-glycero-beta-D-manno-heptose 1-phosphate adenylyltransferase [Prosthecochloris sp. HL-130-GSB]|jgi:D-glycero-beta-D-manno-heptose 1-phosphate adenylyltransferase|uniref:D-glycero-beta-D-manno-heptose 1-phosphate adenylyltransferase n=1 Tax=Prosthecochloris sp. HL-130-GSB TaxID=1974213 RepID=UPI000A1C05E1|nr:D-glycero-beta-D-manno-heptose 1-phosphate adenylyltransferase [Prosthecochloris sp. HL-130-GSB]ARM30251.1 D-glycero-beta-D-manno-heptose 1-phosphate adenylyltransferase [Prosthecochloris sp. HL-130-GSB]